MDYLPYLFPELHHMNYMFMILYRHKNKLTNKTNNQTVQHTQLRKTRENVN